MADRRVCRNCGSPVEGSDTQCHVCGAVLSSGGSPMPAAPLPVAQPQPTPGNPGQPAAPGIYPYPYAYPPYYGVYPYGQSSAAPPNTQGAGTAPGYPAYPQGTPPGGGSYTPYYYGYPYAYPWAYPLPAKPRSAPGETYAKVVSGIVIGAGGLSILCALLVIGLSALIAAAGQFDNLPVQDLLLVPALTGTIGGGMAIYYGIRGIMRRPSPRFRLPHPLLFVGLTAVVLVGEIVLWHLELGSGPGPSITDVPLVLLSGVLPALAILSFTSWRLRMPATRRHVVMSLLYGLTLGPLLALILEIIVSIILRLLPSGASSLSASDPVNVIRLLLEISVAAPIIEEGVKPLGALLIMPRLRTPVSAFLVGLAGGIGFDMFETTFTYIGTGQADWIQVALVRVGAGLLHGLGAGMVALGWYYFINGKGVSRRWLKGIGCMAYAVAQHGIFNASSVLVDGLPEPLHGWLNQVFYVGKLPIVVIELPFFGIDLLILVMLIFITGRLMRPWQGASGPPAPVAIPATNSPTTAEPAPIGGTAR